MPIGMRDAKRKTARGKPQAVFDACYFASVMKLYGAP